MRANDLCQKHEAILRDPFGKLWAVKIYHRQKPRLRLCLAAGWCEFSKLNKLKEGDVCVFELEQNRKDSDNLLMNVAIFPLVV